MVSAEQVYRAYSAAESVHDLTRAAALVHVGLVVQVNGQPAIASGEQDARANAELISCYPDYQREIVEVVAGGSRAAVRWRMPGMPVPAVAGELGALDLHGCSVIEVQDGRTIAASLYDDRRVLDALRTRATGEPA